MTTVLGSGASTRSIVVNTVLTRVLSAGSHDRSRLYLTSAEVSGSPLWNFTPDRSLKTHAVWPCSFHSVARPGWSLPSGWRLIRLSKMLNETRISLADVLMCGSKNAMSPPWAITSSRFCVVCAWAGPPSAGATAAAAPSVAADFNRSRRVSWLMDHLVRYGGPPRGFFSDEEVRLFSTCGRRCQGRRRRSERAGSLDRPRADRRVGGWTS